MRSICLPNEISNSIQVNIGVIGLSGPSQVKGVTGIGKSSICNRLVRPQQYHKQISTLTTVDFYSDIINGSHWIYWNYVIKSIDSKSFAFHIIEQTILINDQTYAPFDNFTESDYISRVISGKINGSKRAYISPSQFSKTQDYDETTLISEERTIDAFLIVYDVSEVASRNYQIQDRFISEILNHLYKIKKPLIIVTSKMDVESSKIRSRLDSIMEKRYFKSIPIVETSAKLNINISSILNVVGTMLINSNQKSLSFNTIRHSHIKLDSYDVAALKHKQIVTDRLVLFNQFVSNGVNKYYDLLWDDFAMENDLSTILAVVDRTILQEQFDICKSTRRLKIQENIINSFMVLFKKLIYQFVDAILADRDRDNDEVVKTLLDDEQFLKYFQNVDLPFDEVMKTAQITSKIDYPLPRFFISNNSSFNKLNDISIYIDEIKRQKKLSIYCEKILTKLESNSDLYLDMSFSDVEIVFREDLMWKELGSSAILIFNQFIDNATKKFKKSFDEKLLELSFMIYSIEPIKTTIQRECKSKRLPNDNILDMCVIESIDKKIYFDNDWFNKDLFQKHRIKWIVKYIGSILSTNPNQCYIFDFNPDACCEHLTKYLSPVSHYIDYLIVVISGDNLVDDIWRDANIATVDLNTIGSENTCPSPVQFIPSSSLQEAKFFENHFSPCQKIVYLTSENTSHTSSILYRLFHEKIVNNFQLSVINFAKNATGSKNKFLDEVIRRLKIEYSSISWSLCPGQHLKKLLNEQTNSHLFNSEPIVLWMIVFCEDSYSIDIPLTFLLSIFNKYVVTDRNVVNGILSISIYYIPIDNNLPQKFSISILTYHQAVKWLTEGSHFVYPQLMIYFCDLFRLASINTMFAVMQNLYSLVGIKSLMCVISSSGDYDPMESVEKKEMVHRLANDINVDCIVIDEKDETSETNLQKLLTNIQECAIISYHVDENKNLCCYNNAFQNDDFRPILKLKTPKDNIVEIHSNENAKCRQISNYEHMPDFKSRFKNNPIMTRSNSQYSSDITFYDAHMKSISFECSLPLGCANEEMFQPIAEESSFDEVNILEDKNTHVYVQCKNKEHYKEIDQEQRILTSPNSKPITNKIRSYSGPVLTNKSFTKKYSTSNMSGSRSQRCTKTSHSLNTSPLTSGIRQISQCQICKIQGEYCLCDKESPQININTTAPTTKLKTIMNRLFSSDRYNNKSADERRSLFRRSFKISKRNSDSKAKTIPPKSGSDPQPTSIASETVCLPLSHSASHSILDMRKRSKSILPLKNL